MAVIAHVDRHKELTAQTLGPVGLFLSGVGTELGVVRVVPEVLDDRLHVGVGTGRHRDALTQHVGVAQAQRIDHGRRGFGQFMAHADELEAFGPGQVVDGRRVVG